MKKIFVPKFQKRSFLLFSLLVLLVPTTTQPAFFSIRSDQYLFETARSNYKERRYPEAAIYFKAYIERDPSLYLTNREHQKQVDAALGFSLYKIEKWRTRMEECILGCGMPEVSGSEIPPEVDPLPVNPWDEWEPEPLPAAHRTYPLVCRGGGNYFFEYVNISSISLNPQLLIRFIKSSRGVGENGEFKEDLLPGQCSWKDRRVGDKEPSWIFITPPVFDPKSFFIGWKEGEVTLGGSDSIDYLRVLEKDRSRFVTFNVYNDSQGHFIVTAIPKID